MESSALASSDERADDVRVHRNGAQTVQGLSEVDAGAIVMTSDAAAPLPDAPAIDAQNPWPGLEAFTEDDQQYFHGRDAEIDELHRLVLRERLTIFFGVSGLGKTSLLQAGLFPILRNENVLPVRIRLNYSEGMPELCRQIKEAIVQAALSAGVE